MGEIKAREQKGSNCGAHNRPERRQKRILGRQKTKKEKSGEIKG